jgi:hypothetical protein
MLRLSTIVAFLALAQSVPVATAHEMICPDAACFSRAFIPYWPRARAHNFHPRLRDGAPLVKDIQTDPEGYYGTGCVWSWRPVAPTPAGPQWAWTRYCVSY